MKTIFIIGLMIVSKFNIAKIIEQQPPKKVIDVVCKMAIDPKSKTIQVHTHEKINYTFCSDICKKAFIKKPEKYIKKEK